jgi:hypothetical protein
MRRVLVVTTLHDPEPALAGFLSDDDEVRVVAPVAGESLLDWLANDQHAFSEAEEMAARAGERLPGETVDARAGDADIELAVRDALASFDADEILIALRANEVDAAENAKESNLDGVPVRAVVVKER